MNWDVKDGGRTVLHVLQKLKNGDITPEPGKQKASSPRPSIDHGSPRQSMDRAPSPRAPASPRASVDAGQGSPVNVRRSVDLRGDPNAGAVLRRKSIDTPPISGTTRASFDSRSVISGHHQPSNLRPSMDMMGGGQGQAYVMGPNGILPGGSYAYGASNPNMMMAPMGMHGSPTGSTSQQQFRTPSMDTMANQFGAMGVSGGMAPTSPAAAPAENSQMIRALADEVARLKHLVEEKRAREQGVGSSPSGGSVTMGVVNLH